MRKESWISLGVLAESGARRELKLDITAEHVVAVVGKRGTGKSYTLGVLIEGLGILQAGARLACHHTSRAAVVLDVLDVFWSTSVALNDRAHSPILKAQLDRMQKERLPTEHVAVKLWLPAGHERPGIDPAGTSSLVLPVNELEAEDWAALFGFDLIAEPRGMLVDEVLRKVSKAGWRDQSGAAVIANPNFGLRDVLECLDKDLDLQRTYQPITIQSVRQRFSSQASNPLFDGPPTPLVQIAIPGSVAIIMLGRLSDSEKQLVSAILVRRIQRSREAASFAQKRLDLTPNLEKEERDRLHAMVSESIPRTWVLADEAQVLSPADESTVSGTALIKFAKEGRNYGLSLAVATQQPSSVDKRLMSQVETLIAHQLAMKSDIDVALQSLKSPVPSDIRIDSTSSTFDALVRSLGQGQAVFSCANASALLPRACVVNIRARITAHGGYEA